jgi:hypothetical protein
LEERERTEFIAYRKQFKRTSVIGIKGDIVEVVSEIEESFELAMRDPLTMRKKIPMKC